MKQQRFIFCTLKGFKTRVHSRHTILHSLWGTNCSTVPVPVHTCLLRQLQFYRNQTLSLSRSVVVGRPRCSLSCSITLCPPSLWNDKLINTFSWIPPVIPPLMCQNVVRLSLISAGGVITWTHAAAELLNDNKHVIDPPVCSIISQWNRVELTSCHLPETQLKR